MSIATSSRKSAVARIAHEAKTNSPAFQASLWDVRRCPIHCAIRKRISRPLARKRGRNMTIRPAPRPAAATMASPARTAAEPSVVAAAAVLMGMSAAASSRPTMKSESASDGTQVGQLGERRTTAMRTTSSNRPGSAAPVTEAAPLAAASDIARGLSDGRKTRCQPSALSG